MLLRVKNERAREVRQALSPILGSQSPPGRPHQPPPGSPLPAEALVPGSILYASPSVQSLVLPQLLPLDQ